MMSNSPDIEPVFKIKGGHLKNILDHLAKFPYSDVHWVMLILENLEIIVPEEPTTEPQLLNEKSETDSDEQGD